VPRPRLQPQLLMLNERHRAHAVPLDLEQPLLAAWRLLRDRGLHGLDRLRHGGGARAFYTAPVELTFFLAGAAFAAVPAAFTTRFAGRLLSHTRSAAPAVLRLVLRAGRLREIYSCVRPESTLCACASTSQPSTATSSR